MAPALNKETISNHTITIIPCINESRLTPLSNCAASQETFESNTSLDGKKHTIIEISTDKDSYGKGETVNIRVKNEGSQPFVFSNTMSNVEIQNLNTGQNYKPSGMFGTLVLEPGATKTFFWNKQVDRVQMIPGNYSVSVSVGSINANATFSISK